MVVMHIRAMGVIRVLGVIRVVGIIRVASVILGIEGCYCYDGD